MVLYIQLLSRNEATHQQSCRRASGLAMMRVGWSDRRLRRRVKCFDRSTNLFPRWMDPSWSSPCRRAMMNHRRHCPTLLLTKKRTTSRASGADSPSSPRGRPRSTTSPSSGTTAASPRRSRRVAHSRGRNRPTSYNRPPPPPPPPRHRIASMSWSTRGRLPMRRRAEGATP